MTQQLSYEVGLFGFVCSYCGGIYNPRTKQFKKLSNLVKHIESMHPETINQDKKN